METVTLSSKGQLVIPRHVRAMANLHTGDMLEVHYLKGEIRLRPVVEAKTSTLAEVAGCLAKKNSGAATKMTKPMTGKKRVLRAATSLLDKQAYAVISARLTSEDAATMGFASADKK